MTLSPKGFNKTALWRLPAGCFMADIPHCLLPFWEYSAVESFIWFSKAFEQLLMLLGEIQPHRPRPRDEEHMNPDNILEAPPRRRVLHGLPLVVRKRCPVVLE